jgi:hypothetical protein
MGLPRRNALLLLVVLIVLVIFVLVIRAQRSATVNDIDPDECTPAVIGDNCPTDIPVEVACGDIFIPSSSVLSYNFDITTFVVPGSPNVDWTTLTIDNTEVATQHFFQTGTQPRCTGDPYPLPADAAFGTHIFSFGAIPFDLCGPGTQTSPTSYTWNGCDGAGGGPGATDGQVYTGTWSHLGNGILNLQMTTTWVTIPFTMAWRITYSFRDVDGCSYTQIAHYSTHMPL